MRRPWSDAFSWNRPGRSADADEAALDLVYFEATRLRRLGQRPEVWDASCSAGLVGNAGRPGLALVPAALLGGWKSAAPDEAASPARRLGAVLWIDQQLRRDEGPPSALYLSIRSARQALRVNPADWRAWTLLGEAYTRLSRQTTERTLGRVKDHDLSLNFLRRVQAVAAFNQALLFRPGLVRAHAALSGHYQDMGYLDLTLTHLRAQVQLVRAGGPQGGETADDFAARVADLQARADRLAAAVDEARKRFETTPPSLPLADKAETARQLGLPETALKILENSNVAAFGASVAALELRLPLLTGRLQEVDAWLVPELASLLGANRYHKFRYLLASALGNGQDADHHLEELAQAFRFAGAESDNEVPRPPLRLVMALAVGEVLPDQPILGRCAPAVGWSQSNLSRTFERMQDWAGGIIHVANLTALRGLLALESGKEAQAAVLFQQALATWRDAESQKQGMGLDFPNRPLVEQHLDRLRRGEENSEYGAVGPPKLAGR